VVAGERISFAEFGEALLRRGLDAPTMAGLVAAVLAGGTRVQLRAVVPVHVDVAPRLTDVEPVSAGQDELRFRVSLGVDLQLSGPKAADGDVVTAEMRVQAGLRVSTMIDPAALCVTLDPVSPEDVRLSRARGAIRGRGLPLPARALTTLLRGRVARELNERLTQASRHIEVAELVTNRLRNPVHGSDR
jgi:hypothetical protein